jgi:hypothetical protein
MIFHSRISISAARNLGSTVSVGQKSNNDRKKAHMNINSIGSSTISSLLNATATQSTNNPSSIPPAANAAASAKFSKPGELMQKLAQLQEQDPAQFKQVLTQLADSLQQVADKSGNSSGMAAKLATAFKDAASTGDLSALQSALQPPNVATAAQANSANQTANAAQGAQGQHHGHHHHHGGGAIASAFATAISQIDAALQGTSTSSTTNTGAATATGST